MSRQKHDRNVSAKKKQVGVNYFLPHGKHFPVRLCIDDDVQQCLRSTNQMRLKKVLTLERCFCNMINNFFGTCLVKAEMRWVGNMSASLQCISPINGQSVSAPQFLKSICSIRFKRYFQTCLFSSVKLFVISCRAHICYAKVFVSALHTVDVSGETSRTNGLSVRVDHSRPGPRRHRRCNQSRSRSGARHKFSNATDHGCSGQKRNCCWRRCGKMCVPVCHI